MWYVYILQCCGGFFYTGVSRDIQKRLSLHNQGKASKYTRARRPVKLLYAEEFDTKGEALKRELEIKDFSAANKKRLIKFGKGRRFPSTHKI